jgi:peptidoglycan-associated lipoprotein
MKTMNRNLVKFGVLALICALAASGCTKKKVAGGTGDVPPLGPIDQGTGTTLPETPAGPGTALTDPATGQKFIVHFDYDSAVVTHDREVLGKVAELMKSKSDLNVTVTGHCDERGSTEYNLSLGERRALSVRAYLTGLGIDGARLSTQSFGEEQPAMPGHDESAWRENRRAEFIAR